MQKNILGLKPEIYNALEEVFLTSVDLSKKIGYSNSFFSRCIKEGTLRVTAKKAVTSLILEGLFNGIRYAFPNELESFLEANGVYSNIHINYREVLNQVLSKKAIQKLELKIKQLQATVDNLKKISYGEEDEETIEG